MVYDCFKILLIYFGSLIFPALCRDILFNVSRCIYFLVFYFFFQTDDLDRSLIVKVIPRIDVDKRLAEDSNNVRGTGYDPKSVRRPAPNLLPLDKIPYTKSHRFNVSNVNLNEWKNHVFDSDGYLYMKTKVQFVKDVDLADDIDNEDNEFQMGEIVEVIASDLRGITGYVKHISKERGYAEVTLTPTEDIGMKEVVVQMDQIRKYLKDGDTVTVIEGEHAGATGLIGHIDKTTEQAFVFLTGRGGTSGNANIMVPASSIRLTSASVSKLGTGSKELQGYNIGDLVQLDDHKVACILNHREGSTFSALFCDGTVANRSVAQVRKIIQATGVACTDSFGRTFTERSPVRVFEGGQSIQGRILYIWNNSVFIKRSLDSSGTILPAGPDKGSSQVIVVTKDRVELDVKQDTAGGQSGYKGNQGTGTRPGMSKWGPRVARGAHYGRLAKIIKGKYKGYLCTVRGSVQGRLAVTLQSTGGELNLERGDFIFLPEYADLESERSVSCYGYIIIIF